jgi:NUMOD3 motif
MFYTIYKITNKVNGKEYTGKHQTNELNDGYMGSGKNIRRAINKHGIENFTKEILHIFDSEEEMNTKEAELVTEEYCTRKDTYNICSGGQGGFGFINKEIWTEEKRLEHNRKYTKFGDLVWRKENSGSKKGGLANRERLISFNKSFKGDTKRTEHLQTQEVNEKRKRTYQERGHQKGEKNSQFGKPRSEETKRKISETLKKKKQTLREPDETALGLHPSIDEV